MLQSNCKKLNIRDNFMRVCWICIDVDSVHFNSAVRLTSQTCKRRRSADRVERKLNTVESVERSHSAGGRLTEGNAIVF